ncbi:DUF3089 domain-containing protein [Nocardioides sp.]|uniref:DUF3089 domain-containing protein n=1 Tax=Nocardioides sp. TaxID=35761 RepID=UPI00356B1E55
MRRQLAAGLAAACLLLGACSGDDQPSADSTTDPTATASASTPAEAAAPSALPVSHPTRWLCHPSKSNDPCDAPLTTTVIRADGSRVERNLPTEAEPPIDCFYVYPTVSEATSDYAPLKVTPALRDVAVAHAAAFSGTCQVFAPVYRQGTVTKLINGRPGTPEKTERAYDDVRSAFHDYLNGEPERRFVLMGHSQGAFVLTRLIQEELDGDTPEAARLRERLVSALLIGAAPKTPPGQPVGGDLQRVPICTAPGERGCVVAYNSYASRPGPEAIFGRTDPNKGFDAVCTSPAALTGAGGDLQPMYPATRAPSFGGLGADVVDTTFVSLPGYLTGRCESRDGFAWLRIAVRENPNDVRPDELVEQLGPDWGLHAIDVSLALGNLVDLVRQQSVA